MKENKQVYYPWIFDTDLMVKFIQEPKLIYKFNESQLKGIDSLEVALQEASKADFNKEKLLSCINMALSCLVRADTDIKLIGSEQHGCY